MDWSASNVSRRKAGRDLFSLLSSHCFCRKIRELQKEEESLAVRGRTRERREILNDIGSLLSEQALPEWPSFLKEMCENGAVVLEKLYSTLIFEAL